MKNRAYVGVGLGKPHSLFMHTPHPNLRRELLNKLKFFKWTTEDTGSFNSIDGNLDE